MPRYRRDYFGTTWFFTVVTTGRKRLFASEAARSCLRSAVDNCRMLHPFAIDAWVLLPDHIHCIWSLDETDPNYSRRWAIIKRRFTQTFRERSCQDVPFWQKRFWEHRIRNEEDYEDHVNYIHFNPVKHGYVASPRDWPWTTFQKFVRNGIYAADWGSNVTIPKSVGNE
ncbi:MAG: transposase [Bacteroidetes bacterium]|nr:transposase [Bacteroidota bacterium]